MDQAQQRDLRCDGPGGGRLLQVIAADLPAFQQLYYMNLLAVDGTLVEVGAPEHPMSVKAFSLMPGRRSLAGSSIGGIPETQEMLDFCAEHGLGAEIEVIAADKINEAWDRVVGSDVRYRFVIDTATLGWDRVAGSRPRSGRYAIGCRHRSHRPYGLLGVAAGRPFCGPLCLRSALSAHVGCDGMAGLAATRTLSAAEAVTPLKRRGRVASQVNI